MHRSMMVISLAGLMSLACLSQTSGGSPQKPSAAPQAADSAARKFYQLNFVVQEIENERVINSRSYSIIMRDSERGSIRAGEKVPFTSGTATTTQWQQINVGVDIDCRSLEDLGTGVSLYIKADISSVMDSHPENSVAATLPIIRNNQWESTVVLPLKQPTVLFSSDDPASKRKMQLQLAVMLIR